MNIEIFNVFLQYGLLGVVLFFLGLGAYLAARSIGRWAVPQCNRVIDAHIQFVEKVDERLEKIEDDIDGIKQITQQQTSILDNIGKSLNGQYKN